VVICAVSGAAGVGKTTLAVSWAHRVAGEFPDGQLYVNLRGFDQYSAPMDPAEAIRGFLDALGVPPHQIPTGLDAQAGLYRSLLSDRRMLVLLDNARDGEQLGPLLPGASRCLVIVTSRDKLVSLVATADAQPLHLDLLTATEARELLACRLGPARTDAEPQAVDEIIEHCSRLPLALVVTAARAATRPGFPLIELVAQLRQARGGLDAFTGMGNADIRSVFSWSYRRLDPAAASLFRLLGLLPSPDVAIPAVASVAGRPTGEVRHLLTELTVASLVTEHGPNRYTFHDLLRAYAAELAHSHDSDSYRRAATRRLLDHYLHTAHAASRLVYPRRQDRTAPPPPDPRAVLIDLTDHEQAMAWFTVEYPALVAAIQTAVASQFDTHAYQLAWALSVFLMLQGRWPEMIATQHTALDAARRMADGSAQAYAHRSIGMAAVELDDHAEADAHLQRALDMLGDLGDSTGAAQTHLGFSRALERQGRHREALRHSIAAHDLYQTAGARSGQANALNSIGWCHSLLGEYHEARAACESALSVVQETAEHWIEAAAWDSLGYVHHHLGDHTRAAVCYQRSLDLCRLLGDRPHEAETLIHLGETRHAAGDSDAARSAWRQALTIRTELNHPDTAQISAKLRHLDDGTHQSSTPGDPATP
jgi:tetratricopeptide (TPR) repeat protein